MNSVDDKEDVLTSRMDVRVGSKFKEKFYNYCKTRRLNSSDTVRKALQQYISLGDFKHTLFNFLFYNADYRQLFENFFSKVTGTDVGKWFEELLGVEEIELIKSTPNVLVKDLKGAILTRSGKKALKERVRD